jgi:2-polyprenyl-6-hydroxyphenyl methylase/3-demethylubiquinone-9 3-methyltransferase
MAKHQAAESRSIERVHSLVDSNAVYTRQKLKRIEAQFGIGPPARVLDIGSAQGLFVIAANELGYDCIGVEPSPEARRTAEELGARLGVANPVSAGWAEDLPFEDASFDVIHASSVFEHVIELKKALSEAARVLRPGGVLWFSSASSVCPRQHEIAKVPFFGWYPLPLKRRVMYWARDRHPDLIGGTDTPAIHWFTPRSATRMLHEAGFTDVVGRWQLRQLNEQSGWKRQAVAAVKNRKILSLAADVVVPGCSYAAVR